MNNTSISNDSRSFISSVSDVLIGGTNYVVKKAKYTVAPLSSSLPLTFAVKIADRSLKLASYIKQTAVFPNMAKTLEGTTDVLGIGASLNLILGLLPCLPITNLDEEKLKESIAIDQLDLTNVSAEKWQNRVLKQVKASLNRSYTTRNVRIELEKFLIDKGLGAEQAAHIAGSIIIQAKSRHLAEKMYLACFLLPGVNTIVNTLEKWNLIQMASWSAKIGNIPAVNLIVKKIGDMYVVSLVAKTVAKLGLRQIALYSALLGLTIKGSYEASSLIKAQMTICMSDKNSPEYAKAITERTKQIWSFSITGLGLAGGVVPLFLSVNPALLLSYEIGAAAISFANALRQQP